MSHATADLEYFKCDVCGVYLHQDIFCDHRRECKGLGSTELKKSECRKIQELLGKDTRAAVIAQLEKDKASEAAAQSTQAPAAEGRGKVNVLLSTDQMDRRRDMRVRREMANAYQKKQAEAFESEMTEAKRKELLDFLNS